MMAQIKVEDIRPAQLDFAGQKILCVYTYNPPDYAVYRTPARVVVQFADDKATAREQRTRLSPLTPLRGQINALIDGWHTSGQPAAAGQSAGDPAPSWRRFVSPSSLPWVKSKHRSNRKRADHYDRRVADAITTALENDVPTALALLADVKNDIISERTSIARTNYMITAFLLSAFILLLMSWLAHGHLERVVQFIPPRGAIWTAISGGTVGAFFSIAIGLKGRQLVIDLQNRDNRADAILRVLIGAMSGGLLLCLLLSRLVQISGIRVTSVPAGGAGSAQSDVLVFVVGFFAGFFERLVPDLLSKTSLGTKEGEGTSAGSGGMTPHSPAVPPLPPHPPGGATAVSDDEHDGCLAGTPDGVIAETPDSELPPATGGVEAPVGGADGAFGAGEAQTAPK
jgi:hypothetical protein